MNDVFLGLGSNKGDKLEYLRKTIRTLSDDKNFRIEKISSLYLTKPFGIIEQENYFNVVVRLSSMYDHFNCFFKIKEIEKVIGRKESVRWGPREIDIDILFFNDIVFESDELIIPHKGIIERDFFIVPLLEIDSGLYHYGAHIKLKDIDLTKLENHIIEKHKFDFNLE